MRVTKIIREYVEKTINEKLAYGAPTANYNAAVSKMKDLREEVNDQVVAYAEKLCAEATAKLPKGFSIKLHFDYPVTSNSYNSPLYCAARKHEDEIQNKRREAIDNILLNLELGATKADLERLIAEAIGE